MGTSDNGAGAGGVRQDSADILVDFVRDCVANGFIGVVADGTDREPVGYSVRVEEAAIRLRAQGLLPGVALTQLAIWLGDLAEKVGSEMMDVTSRNWPSVEAAQSAAQQMQNHMMGLVNACLKIAEVAKTAPGASG